MLFGPQIAEIMKAYFNGSIDGVRIEDNGLLHAYQPNRALTWMDSYIDENPVTQRPGYAVEVNGLWYNALCLAHELSVFSAKSQMGIRIKSLVETFPQTFTDTFWNSDLDQMADYVFEGESNMDIRPNAMLAAAMPYSPLNDEQIRSVLEVVRRELLTPKGLRTLSPRFEMFAHSYEGDHFKRDQAYHQGTVWPWLLGFFAEAWLSHYGDSGKEFLERIVRDFEEDMIDHGICNLSEVYDGSPPHRACGAISFAPSVAEILRILELLSN